MKRYKKQWLRHARILFAVLILLMAAGSIWDLPISRALYPGHESSIGQFFAAFGGQPAFLAISAAGALLLLRRKSINPGWNTLLAFSGGALILFGIVMNVHEAVDNVAQLPLWVAALMTVFMTLVCSVLLAAVSREASTKTVLRFILTVTFVAIVTALLINVIKIPWGRVRMRLIVQAGNESYFTPWWQAGGTLKRQLLAEGVAKSEFRSFPSGHTACAACAMLMILLPTLSKRLQKRTTLCFLLGCVWTLGVALSRICMGAHFLTDVTAASLVFLGVASLGIWLFYLNPRVFGRIWNFLAARQSPLQTMMQQKPDETE